jgi:hypothetical protein
MWNPIPLAHVVNGDAQVDGFVHQHKLTDREFVHEARPVQRFVPHLDIEVVDETASITQDSAEPRFSRNDAAAPSQPPIFDRPFDIFL